MSSCDAGAHPASSAEDGSQKPPCDPNLKPPKGLRDHHCSSVRRASGLVQTPQCSLISSGGLSGHVAFRPEPTIISLMGSPNLGEPAGQKRLHRNSSAYSLQCRSELPVRAASSVLPIEFADYIRFNRAALKSSALPRVISTRRERKPKAVSDFH